MKQDDMKLNLLKSMKINIEIDEDEDNFDQIFAVKAKKEEPECQNQQLSLPFQRTKTQESQ